MNRIKKNITVRFFSLKVNKGFFDEFVSSFRVNQNNGERVRITSLRRKKHFIKILDDFKISRVQAYSVVVVKERNTWQVKADSSGKISGIGSNQGIIGDFYFFLVVPQKKILLGFTTGPGGSLKGVGVAMLDQFSVNRKAPIRADLIPIESKFSALKELPLYSSLHFKINSSSLADIADDAPQLIKDLSAAPYIDNNMQLALDFEFSGTEEDALSKEKILEIVNYLSEHDGCTVLKIKGVGTDGAPTSLDFGNAFYNYKTEIFIRNKHVDVETSSEVLKAALSAYLQDSSE